MKTDQRQLRHRRIRSKIAGTSSRPRMNVFRSLSHIYVQFIDDEQGVTLASASTKDKEISTKGKKVDMASAVGKLAAEKAQKSGITEVVFDRGGYRYHGRVKALADSARAAGLKF